MNEEDRSRLHELLDWAINHDESFAIAQYARMDLDWHIHKEIYRLSIKKEHD